jgi:hypothetical protein
VSNGLSTKKQPTNHHIIGFCSSSSWARRHPKEPPPAAAPRRSSQQHQQRPRRTIRWHRPLTWLTKTSGHQTATTAVVAVRCTKRMDRIHSIPLRLGRRDFHMDRRGVSHWTVRLPVPVPLSIHNHRTIRNITCMDNESIHPIKCRRCRINNQHQVNKSPCRRHELQAPSPRYVSSIVSMVHLYSIIQCFSL